MIINALVINLDQSTERMAFQKQQLERLAIPFQRLSATSVSCLNKATFQRYRSTWERPLRASEVACFLSHQRAWEQVANSHQPWLILEDDALLSYQLPDLLKRFSSLTQCDLITLEARSRKKIMGKQGRFIHGCTQLFPLYQDRTGAAGYLLWPSGAHKLLARLAKGRIALADAFISSTYTLNAFQAEPAAIIQLDQCHAYGIVPPITTSSAISTHQKPTLQITDWPYRMKRIIGQWRLGVRQLTHLFKAKRRFVDVNPKHFYNANKRG